MGNTWIWIPLITAIGTGLLYLGFKESDKRGPIEFVRTIIVESIGIAADLFFGLFGLNTEQIKKENERRNSSEKEVSE